MIAGLLFATHDADDRPDRLAATLPFGGVTLIEYQARLLIAAGASQIIVVVARLTPELLGAVARIGRRGVVVDPVRSAGEAAEKLHPLARVLMLADGLITTASVVGALAGEGGDALLVVPETEASTAHERVGGQMAWAGVARLDPRRIAEVAELPRDYDLQSTLLRLAAQARATQVMLPADAIRNGHGIVHQARALDERGRAVIASIVSGRRSWFDRFVLAPIARAALPPLVDRGVSAAAMGIGGAVAGVAGIAGILAGFPASGVMAVLVGCVALAIGVTLAGLRDEPGLARGQSIGIGVLPALAALATGWLEGRIAAEDGALVIALALVAIGALAERAIRERDRLLWWGSPPGYLVVVAIGAIVRLPVVGLAVAAVYAIGTAAAAIEHLRREP